MHDVITPHDWERWAFMFEDGGMEIYESTTKTYAVNEIHDAIGGPSRQQLEVREVLEQVKTRYFELQNLTAGFEEDQKQRVLSLWVSHLKQLVGPIRKQGAREALRELQEGGLELDETISLSDDDGYRSEDEG